MGLIPRRRPGVARAATLAALLGARIAAAQADTMPRDTMPRDTTGRDTAAVDLPVFARELLAGPLPPGARYVFDTDSLVFSNAYTLSDLLAHVPGVYVARGGFFGQAEYVLYAGRGPAALEVYWDGVPYLPIGRDSVFLDPARIPLAPVERVEVVPLPGLLRVYLVSRREASTHAASSVGIVTGDRNIARYRALFARRWRSGGGLSLLVDWHDIDGTPGSSSTAFRDVDVWVNAEYTPSPRVGVSYQVVSSTWSRDADAAGVDHWEFKRQDGLLRFFVAPRGDSAGLAGGAGAGGPRFQITLASTRAEADSAVAPRSTSQVIFDAVRTWPHAQASVAARLGDRRRPLELEGRASWRPLRGVTLAGEARRSRYFNRRTGGRAHLSAGLDLFAGVSLRGEAVWSDDLQAPLLAADTLQRSVDLAWGARWERSWITLEVGGGRRDRFAPGGAMAGLKPIAGFDISPGTEYIRVSGAVRPVPWLSFAGWYFDPLSGGGDFEPPRHARVSATFFSRFLRTFPSTIFVLRGEVAVESWGSWVGGVTGTSRNELIGATFVDTNLELRIGDVVAFWTMRNANGMRASYVPGLGYPKQLQYWGVQWQFRN